MKNGGNQQSESGGRREVGQSRDGDPLASYALYDYEQHLLLMHRVNYHIRKALARFKNAGLSSHNANRLAKGE